jgi:hypothetical protein
VIDQGTVALVRELRQAGVVMTAVGDRLRVDAPIGALRPRVKNELRRRKAAIISLVQSRTFPCSTCGRFAFHHEATCYWCRQKVHERGPKSTLTQCGQQRGATSVEHHTAMSQTAVEQAENSLARERVFQELGEPCDVRAAEGQLAAAEADLEPLLTDSRHQQQDRIEGNSRGGWSLERVGASSGTRGVNP